MKNWGWSEWGIFLLCMCAVVFGSVFVVALCIGVHQ